VKRILTVGLMSPRFRGYKYSNKPDLNAHALIARQAAAEGMVLLKNDNSALPFAPDIKKLATFGITSKDIRQTATFSLEKELMVKKETEALAPKQPINELKPRP
jgi:beta-glucosidase-like glycosyl hydrolase